MAVIVKTDAIQGSIKEETTSVHEIAKEIESGAFAVNVGPEVSVKTRLIRSFYSGEPEDEMENAYAVFSETGDQFVVTLPEGQDARDITKMVNKVAAGEKDQYGNRRVLNPFVVIGDGHAVGILYEDYAYSAKVAKKKTEEEPQEDQ